MGLQTGAALGARDVFYLGRFAYMQNKPYVALNWLHEASTQASIVNDKTIEENQVCAKQVFNRLSYLRPILICSKSKRFTNFISLFLGSTCN